MALRQLQGPSSDALCNGVYVTPSRRTSDYGRLRVVLDPPYTRMTVPLP
jgi:hypothetical protein